MAKILICIMLLTSSFGGAIDRDKIKLNSRGAINEDPLTKIMIDVSVREAAEGMEVSEKDSRKFISIESSGRAVLMGTSGEFGLMQIMPYEFTNYGPEINEMLIEEGRTAISWETDDDKLHPRNNIMVGAYSFRKRLRTHKQNPIWASMSYNVGDRGVKVTRNAWRDKEGHWYCVQIKPSIRRGRQFTYSHKFARKSGRLGEWRKMFGDIPKHVMEQFWKKNGDTYCKELLGIIEESKS